LAGGDLDETVRRADPDRWLATRFIGDPARRDDVLVLYAFDAELARACRVTTSALTAGIRLTWWAEVLQDIEADRPVRAHPLARELAAVVARHGLPVAPLEAMVEGRIEAVGSPGLDLVAAERWAADVGGSAAVLAALVLGAGQAAGAAAPAGRLIGYSLLARDHGLDRQSILPLVEGGLRAANEAARELPPAAFPVIAAATLVRSGLSDRPPSELSRRLRLIWAVARGRV
jgi:phytoene synthase